MKEKYILALGPKSQYIQRREGHIAFQKRPSSLGSGANTNTQQPDSSVVQPGSSCTDLRCDSSCTWFFAGISDGGGSTACE